LIDRASPSAFNKSEGNIYETGVWRSKENERSENWHLKTARPWNTANDESTNPSSCSADSLRTIPKSFRLQLENDRKQAIVRLPQSRTFWRARPPSALGTRGTRPPDPAAGAISRLICEETHGQSEVQSLDDEDSSDFPFLSQAGKYQSRVQ
jgi:hypothetical protein